MAVNLLELEERLGQLAMAFRRNFDDSVKRQQIAADYCDTVESLIQSGQWKNVPPPEDQLPDEFMPNSFLPYWFRKYPSRP